MSSHASDAPPVDGVNVNNSGIFGAPAGPRVGDRFVAPGAGAKRVQMAQSGLKSFFPGASAETTNTEAELVGAPGRKRTKKEDIHERVEYKGKTIDTIKGTSVVEDKEWVLILNKDQHGNKEYVCLRCNT